MSKYKSSIITGASSGIGRALSVELGKSSTVLYLVGRNKEELIKTSELVECRSEIVVADLSTQDGIDKVVKVISNNNLDLLVNNAGFGSGDKFHKRELKKEVGIVHVNIEAVVKLSHAYINKALMSNFEGTILNVGSVVSFFPRPNNITYAASKAFIKSFSNALHRKYKEKDIFVSCLYPGLTYTNFFDDPKAIRRYRYLGQEPEYVAAVAIKGLRKKRRVIIPGIINYLVVILGKYLYKYF